MQHEVQALLKALLVEQQRERQLYQSLLAAISVTASARQRMLEDIVLASKVALSADKAACIAKALLASNLSDTTLSGLAQDFTSPQVLETEAKDVEPAVEAAAQHCSGPTG